MESKIHILLIVGSRKLTLIHGASVTEVKQQLATKVRRTLCGMFIYT